MSQRSKLIKSRREWKEKAVRRADENRQLRKEVNRVKKERNQYKERAKKAEKALEEREDDPGPPAARDKATIVLLALRLFCEARIGFRATSRVLEVLKDRLGLEKAPCRQTIINWVIGYSIFKTGNLPPSIPDRACEAWPAKRYIHLIDTTMVLGMLKILCVLVLEAGHYAAGIGAPRLRDVRCVGVATASSWTGEAVADFLKRMFGSFVGPVCFLKDGGKDLAKAVKILREEKYEVSCIDDVSHTVANLLKREYGDDPVLRDFVSTCGKVSKKLKECALAFLAPPEISTNAKFMNLHRLAAWARRLLDLSPRGRAARGSMLERLRGRMENLPSFKGFLRKFLRDATCLLECQKILKNKGLCEETVAECRSRLESVPSSSPVRSGFEIWLEKHSRIARELLPEGVGLPVCSDVVESLFGVAKSLGAGETLDAGRIALRLPALCGSPTKEDAQGVLAVTVEQRNEVVGQLKSQVKLRREVFSRPERLEAAGRANVEGRFELIAGSGNRTKKEEIPCVSDVYEIDRGPAKTHGARTGSPPSGGAREPAATA